MSQAKSGILVLTDPQYENFLHQKEEANRLQRNLHSEDHSPVHQHSVPENEILERADHLLAQETAHQVGSILRRLGLQEVKRVPDKASLIPAHVTKPKFSSNKELMKSVNRLTEKKLPKQLLVVEQPEEAKVLHRRAVTEKTEHRPQTVRQVSVLDEKAKYLSSHRAAGGSITPPSSPHAAVLFPDSDSEVDRPHFDPNAQFEAKRLESALKNPVLLPSKRTLSKYLTEVKSVETAIWEKSTARTDDVGSMRSSVRLSSPTADNLLRASGDNLVPTSAKRRNVKVKRHKKKTPRTLSSPTQSARPTSEKPRELPKVLSEEQKQGKVMHEIRTMGLRRSEEDPSGKGLGDLMRICFRCEPEKALKRFSSLELVRMKNLNSRLYSMLTHDPSELYRIISDPRHSVLPI